MSPFAPKGDKTLEPTPAFPVTDPAAYQAETRTPFGLSYMGGGWVVSSNGLRLTVEPCEV